MAPSSHQAGPRQGLHGERLARHFGIRATSSLPVGRGRLAPLVLTRLQGQVIPDAVTAPLRPEAAFSIVIQLRPLQHHDLRVTGRVRHAGMVPAGAVSALSLGDTPRSTMRGTFDAMQLYLPDAVLHDVAAEEGFARPVGLSWPRDRVDPVALSLVKLLLPAIERPDPARAVFVDHLVLAFLAHVAHRYGQVPTRVSPRRGGLAPWQERRAKEVMRARLASSMTITEVSRACGLSPSYFAAAFRRSTGRSPHQYLSALRIDEARTLMMTTGLPLADIALSCGFHDQSYFTRVFSRAVGTSPGQWRRLHAPHPLALSLMQPHDEDGLLDDRGTS
ncbi:helix-turn-helix transcriptional regulator [Methylobacterium nonmethylotrophicum]|uniref:AraC family transcriptional regulator n=1 Tax=Methylobacterium nonmethylotrophicum TaxID=1141884 RepID=A0A4Z0NY86_9HYPH|nr:AraC family transcriptional regulator [Methylobacterium nonmethylotrophicum]TGE02421.1 AraC family transcriptional regulator [Methylobacterium nonmethylotrophicum]